MQTWTMCDGDKKVFDFCLLPLQYLSKLVYYGVRATSFMRNNVYTCEYKGTLLKEKELKAAEEIYDEWSKCFTKCFMKNCK